jgi:N-methylhydantoinase B
VKCRPWGLFGGLPAAGNGVAIHRFAEGERNFPSGKAFNQMLHSGDADIPRSGDGGGFGSPRGCDLDALENDVRQGYLTREAAERDHGAVFVGEGQCWIGPRSSGDAPRCGRKACLRLNPTRQR